MSGGEVPRFNNAVNAGKYSIITHSRAELGEKKSLMFKMTHSDHFSAGVVL